MSELLLLTQTIFQKELILVVFQRPNYYHKIKYIIFKSSSSKYNEVSHYHICLIKELPVYKNTSLNQQSSSGQRYINIAGSNQKSLGSLEERNLLTLPKTWGLRPHPQTKLLNMGSASLPPAKAENMESNQSQQSFSHSNSSSQR